MKKIGMKLLVVGFITGSMYITNQIITVMQKQDPIMKQINIQKKKYEVLPTNAIVDKDGIIPGIYGIKIDEEESYHKMKKYGAYNESLTVLKEEKPQVSIEDHYEYYISKGNQTKRQISLIFKVEDKSPKNILEILKKENVSATFFIDGKKLEAWSNLIQKYPEHEYEILSYNQTYNNVLMKTSSTYLETITKQKTKYCYTEENNEKLLKNCKKEKKHTIKPLYHWKESPYYNINKKLESGSIYSIDVNEKIEKEITSVIKYIKSHGYTMVILKTLLAEQE